VFGFGWVGLEGGEVGEGKAGMEGGEVGAGEGAKFGVARKVGDGKAEMEKLRWKAGMERTGLPWACRERRQIEKKLQKGMIFFEGSTN